MAYKTLQKESFNLIETNRTINVEKLLGLINGNGAIIIVKKYLEDNLCQKITDNFIGYENSKSRNDKVPWNYIGAFHYNKTLENYFREVELSKESITALLSNTIDPIFELQAFLKATFIEHGFNFRLA